MDGGRDALAGRIPVTLLTGFLGAGKTTLLARLVRHPDMQRVAVVINEVGEIGIDHDIVAMASENIALLANGCICCSVRTDLQDTLRELFGQRRAGAIADFDRVIIETTGLADPAPVLQTLASDTLIATHYRLDGAEVRPVADGNGNLGRLLDPQLETALAQPNPDQEARDRAVAHDALAAAVVRREGPYKGVSQPAVAGSGHGSSGGG